MRSVEVVEEEMVALVVVRDGRVPAGADEAVAESGGAVVIVGPGAGADVVESLPSAERVWWADTPSARSPASQPTLADLAPRLALALADCLLVILPASPDGRDSAPRLAARMGRPLLAGTVRVGVRGGRPEADLLRADGRVVVPVSAPGPAVATLLPGSRGPAPAAGRPTVTRLDLGPTDVGGTGAVAFLEMVEPDPATMDLADASKVLAGGAGLVPRQATDEQARAVFGLLTEVAAALGASAGATRVVTDAGWMPYDRQIGTTGVSLQPDVYLALGVSGASQHIGGIGDPRRVVSVNLDPSCPMTARADLGLIADAPGLLLELATRLGLPIPAELSHRAELPHPAELPHRPN